jgi:hypothetical protein
MPEPNVIERKRPSYMRFGLLFAVVLAASIGVALIKEPGKVRSSAAPWQVVAAIRGRLVSELRAARGPSPRLDQGSVGHVVYIFSPTCPVCDDQRGFMASSLSALAPGRVITGAPQDSIPVTNYWRDVEAPLSEPTVIDSAWLRASGFPKPPLLLFVSKSGHILAGITGNISEWTPTTMPKYLRMADLYP